MLTVRCSAIEIPRKGFSSYETGNLASRPIAEGFQQIGEIDASDFLAAISNRDLGEDRLPLGMDLIDAERYLGSLPVLFDGELQADRATMGKSFDERPDECAAPIRAARLAAAPDPSNTYTGREAEEEMGVFSCISRHRWSQHPRPFRSRHHRSDRRRRRLTTVLEPMLRLLPICVTSSLVLSEWTKQPVNGGGPPPLRLSNLISRLLA